MAYLAYATQAGLLMDILGFLLVVLYGHALFIRSGSAPPQDSVGRDGDLYIQHENGDTEAGAQQHRARYRKAWAGVWLVVVGFGLQILGTTAAQLG